MDDPARTTVQERLQLIWIELVYVSVAIYGLSWTLTRSSLFERPRKLVKDVPLLGKLSKCIVCMSAWVGLFICPLLEFSSLSIRMDTATDVLLWLGWVIGFVWLVANAVGDAN